jgi:superfamily II DNA/RNA helicase
MFLGQYSLQEMQSRWFVNDSFNVGTYRLKKHAADDFWQWVASWAVCLEKPSDMGYEDGGFNLPPLRTVEHVLENAESAMSKGMLFDLEKISAAKVFKELRKSTPARANHAASIVNSTTGPCLVWCQTNDEADALIKAIPDAVEVRGSQKPEKKEELLDAFATGKERVLITKASIAGWGLNFQHCADMVTVSPSYSFEMRYQAVRRCWRFGQTQPVTDNIIMTQKEAQIYHANQHKEKMHTDMVGIFRKTGHDLMPKESRKLEEYKPKTQIKLPAFLRTQES